MLSLCTRCTRLYCAIVVTALLSSAEAQRPSLRSTPGSSSVSTRSASASRERAKPFAVESFSPKGPADADAVISASFNRDVISEEQLDTADVPQSVFSFEPSVEGHVQWESPRQVRFVPRRALRQATEYVVRINPLLKSTAGEKLAKPGEYRFQTPALSLKELEQERFLPGRRAVLSLKFSDKVNAPDLRKYVTILAGRTELPWETQSEVATDNPHLVTDAVSTDTLRVVLEPGLTGAGGPLGLRNRVEKTVELNFSLKPVSLRGVWVRGKPRLVLNFTNYVSTGQANEFVTIEPPVKVTFNSDDRTLIMNGDFEPEKRYSVTVKHGFQGQGEAMVMETAELVAWMPPLSPFLDLPDSSGYLGTNSRMKLKVRSASINKLTVTARRIFDSNMVYHQVFGGSWQMERLGRQVAKQTYEIAMVPNQVQNSEIDLKELLGPGATGIYGINVKGETPSKELIITSYTTADGYDSEARSDSRLERLAMINLSNLGIVSKNGQGEVLVWVAALDTAQPLPGISVSIYSDKNQLLGEATTDEQGMALVKNIPHNDPDVSPAVVIARNADKTEISLLSLSDSLMFREEFESSGRNFIKDGYEAFLTPERGAYRPGETVHVSGFIRGKDSAAPEAAFPVEVVLERSDGKKLTPEMKTPSGTGLLNFDISVPPYAPTGQYAVEVRLPGTGDTEEGEDYEY